ncbi:hypothetical protein GALL_474480 [mine drainage metagenome]|uniref:Uncharacterized protein n=1 Tax=mine drainage metagenome TaxID=410659 RepID=A0A1J5PJF8_9ZZZZ
MNRMFFSRSAAICAGVGCGLGLSKNQAAPPPPAVNTMTDTRMMMISLALPLPLAFASSSAIPDSRSPDPCDGQPRRPRAMWCKLRDAIRDNGTNARMLSACPQLRKRHKWKQDRGRQRIRHRCSPGPVATAARARPGPRPRPSHPLQRDVPDQVWCRAAHGPAARPARLGCRPRSASATARRR